MKPLKIQGRISQTLRYFAVKIKINFKKIDKACHITKKNKIK